MRTKTRTIKFLKGNKKKYDKNSKNSKIAIKKLKTIGKSKPKTNNNNSHAKNKTK